MKEYYSGPYIDQFGKENIVVENDFQNFRIKIREIVFQSTDFEDLSPINIQQIDHLKLKNFELLNNALFNFSLEIKLPLNFIDLATNETIKIDAKLKFELIQERQNKQITLILAGTTYTASSDLIETLFDQLQKQFKGKFRFKNCYGCLFADYSIYGQGFIGTMGCFKAQKKAYLNIKNKDDYMLLAATDFCVQEIFCCPEFKVRDRNIGYRGTIL